MKIQDTRRETTSLDGIREKGFSSEKKDPRTQQLPLCREPWENFYILRRGILPCCYGNPIGYSMSEWSEAWNSSKIQEIRLHLSQGNLSPYCLECLGCPIVQRYLASHGRETSGLHRKKPLVFRVLNRLLFRIPSKIYTKLKG